MADAVKAGTVINGWTMQAGNTAADVQWAQTHAHTTAMGAGGVNLAGQQIASWAQGSSATTESQGYPGYTGGAAGLGATSLAPAKPGEQTVGGLQVTLPGLTDEERRGLNDPNAFDMPGGPTTHYKPGPYTYNRPQSDYRTSEAKYGGEPAIATSSVGLRNPNEISAGYIANLLDVGRPPVTNAPNLTVAQRKAEDQAGTPSGYSPNMTLGYAFQLGGLPGLNAVIGLRNQEKLNQSPLYRNRDNNYNVVTQNLRMNEYNQLMNPGVVNNVRRSDFPPGSAGQRAYEEALKNRQQATLTPEQQKRLEELKIQLGYARPGDQMRYRTYSAGPTAMVDEYGRPTTGPSSYPIASAAPYDFMADYRGEPGATPYAQAGEVMSGIMGILNSGGTLDSLTESQLNALADLNPTLFNQLVAQQTQPSPIGLGGLPDYSGGGGGGWGGGGGSSSGRAPWVYGTVLWRI